MQDVITDGRQIQMRKLIKTSTVHLCGKSETNCVSTGLHYDATGEKTIYWGTNYQRTINTGTLVLCLISSCGNSHIYKSCSSNLIICYSFNGQIIMFDACTRIS